MQQSKDWQPQKLCPLAILGPSVAWKLGCLRRIRKVESNSLKGLTIILSYIRQKKPPLNKIELGKPHKLPRTEI
jgi:hypothetical protein